MKARTFRNSQVGTVAIVDAPVSQWYVRRARLTFLVVGFTTAVMSCAAVAMFAPLLPAVALCIPIGLVCGFAAAATVRVWPVLRALWWWSIESPSRSRCWSAPRFWAGPPGRGCRC